MNWKKERLKSLGWLRSAGVNKLVDPNQKEVRLINYMDVYRNHQITDKIEFQKVTAKDSEIVNANVVVGDVLFTPSSEKPTDIGHAGVVMQNLKNTVYSYHLVRFRFHDISKFDPLFLSYLLNTSKAEKHFVTRATGTTRYTLSLKDFQSLEIEYPEDVKEQKAIATILSKVDEAIRATENSIKAAEKLKKSLMQNLLTGKLKPDGTWRKEDEFYKDEKFGNVPVGWEVKKLKKIFKLKNGKGNPTENLRSEPIAEFQIPVYGGNGITGYFDKPFLTSSTLIIGRVGEYCGSVYKTPNQCWVTDNALWISEVFIESFDLDFWYSLLTFKKLNQYGDATGQPKITQSGIVNLKVAYPPNIEEQNNISSKIIQIDSLILEKKSNLQSTIKLKKALMQNLLTGKVRIDLSKISNVITGEAI